jgi:hypothetical protein
VFRPLRACPEKSERLRDCGIASWLPVARQPPHMRLPTSCRAILWRPERRRAAAGRPRGDDRGLGLTRRLPNDPVRLYTQLSSHSAAHDPHVGAWLLAQRLGRRSELYGVSPGQPQPSVDFLQDADLRHLAVDLQPLVALDLKPTGRRLAPASSSNPEDLQQDPNCAAGGSVNVRKPAESQVIRRERHGT